MRHDPVCGMEVKSSTDFHSEYKGTTYDFCSKSCKTKFDSEPEKYIQVPATTNTTGIKAGGDMERIQIPIIGMNCAACAVTIEKEIKKLSGIERATVNYSTENYTV